MSEFLPSCRLWFSIHCTTWFFLVGLILLPVLPLFGQPGMMDHVVDKRRQITFIDLTHGDGLLRLALKRVWLGDKTLNQHFGPGWSDPNLIRLSQVSSDTILLLQGGTDWQLAHRSGDNFSLAEGLTLKETGNGWLMQSPQGGKMTFNVEGRLTTVMNKHDLVTQITYDESGRLTALKLGPGNFLHYNYGPGGRVTRIDGPEGLVVHYEYHTDGRLAAVTNARNVRVEYRYDKDGNLSSASDSFGNTWLPKLSEDSPSDSPSESLPGTPMESILTGINQDLPQPEIVVNDEGLIVKIGYGNRTVSYVYGCCGQVTEIHGLEGITRLEYDAFGRRTSIQKPDGTTTRIVYNLFGLPARIERSDGSWTTFTYNKHGNLTQTIESSGAWQKWMYDRHGRSETYHASPDYQERYRYNQQGRLASISYSTGNEVRYQYDTSGNIIEERWASGEHSRWQFDEKGWCKETVGPLGLKTLYGHDNNSRSQWIEDSLHGRRTIRTSGDGGRRMVLDWDGIGSTSILTDRFRRPIETVSPSGNSVRYIYDEMGKISAVLDASGAPWQYTHDSAGRLKTILSPGGVSTQLEYNQLGHLTRVNRGSVNWRQYVNEPSGRLSIEKSPAGVAAAYQYDNVGRVGNVTIPEGKVTYQYDKSGQLATMTGPNWALKQDYHADGQLARQKYKPAGLDLKFPLDRFGRRAGIRLNTVAVDYHYDTRGQLDRIALPGGISIRVESDEGGRVRQIRFGEVAQFQVAYDQLDQIVELKAHGSTDFSILTEKYTYDRAGELVHLQAENKNSIRFAYDVSGKFVEIGTRKGAVQLAYDVDGNIREAAVNLHVPSTKEEVIRWELDELGRPQRAGAQQFFTWDKSGNLTNILGQESNEDYKFNAAGQLVRHKKDGRLTTYGYLPGGDRLWKNDAKGTCWYAYLPEGLVGMKDPAGVTWLLVTLPGTDWPLALCGSDGTIRFLIADRLRSIRRSLDISGRLVSKTDYQPLGEVILQEGRSPLEIYAGMVRDDDLYYARSRYYSPSIARFISIDPLIGIPGVPSSHNAYSYAANNPLHYRDPLGAAVFNQGGGQIPARSPAIDNMYDKLTKFGSDFHGLEPTATTKAPNVSPPNSPALPPRIPPTGRTPSSSSSRVTLSDPYKNLDIKPGPLSSTLRNPAEVFNRPVARRTGLPPRYRLNKYVDPRMQSFRQLVPDNVKIRLPDDWGDVGGRLSKVWTAYNVLDQMSQGDYWAALNTAVQELTSDLIEATTTGLPMRGTVTVALADLVWNHLKPFFEARNELALNEQQEANSRNRIIPQKLMEAMQKNPDITRRLIPFAGQPLPEIDPNDPDSVQRHLDEIIRRVQTLLDIIRNNIRNNRRPYEGVFVRPQDIDGSNKTPARKLYEDRLAEAQELIRRGRKLSSSVRSGRVAVEKIEQGIRRSLRDVKARLQDLGPLRKTLDELIQATKDLNKLVDEARRAAIKEKDGSSTLQADWDAVIKQAEENANTICGWAKPEGAKAMFGPSGQLADRDHLKKQANDLIRETAKAIEDAEKQKTEKTSVDPPNDDEIQAAINRVKALKKKLSGELESIGKIDKLLAAARKVIDQARTMRKKVNNELNELNGLKVGPRVNEMLAPYDMEGAIELRVQADNIEEGIGPFELRVQADSIEEGIGPLRHAVGMMNRTTIDLLLAEAREVKKKLDRFVKDAEPALKEAQSALDNAKKVVEEDDPYVDPIDGRTRSLKALQRAMECYSKIKKPKTNPDATRPGTQELTGNIGGTESVSLMRRRTPSEPGEIKRHATGIDRPNNKGKQTWMTSPRGSSERAIMGDSEGMENIQVGCSRFPGSRVYFDDSSGKNRCGCFDGLKWNLSKTQCVTAEVYANELCARDIPGSYAKGTMPDGKKRCICPEGMVLNSSGTKCEKPKSPRILCQKRYPGSVYTGRNADGKVQCNCPQGTKWNSARTRCVKKSSPQEICTKSFPGSVPTGKGASGKLKCNCPQGTRWNSARTRCVKKSSPQEICTKSFPGSVPTRKGASGKLKCNCPQGTRWNSARTRCVKKPSSPNPRRVEDARQGHFVGRFVWTDPLRSYQSYHGVIVLSQNGVGKSREWKNGKPVKVKYPETMDAQGFVPVNWSYRNKIFTLDWSCGGRFRGLGRFSGRVKGYTNHFFLSGHWVGGRSGRIEFQRK